MGVGIGNKNISTGFTAVSLFVYHAAALLCKTFTHDMCFFMAALICVVTAVVYNMLVPMPLLHVSLLLDFTAAAAAEEL